MKLRTATPASVKSIAKRAALVLVIMLIAVVTPIQISQSVSADQYDDKINALQQDINKYQAESNRLNGEAITLQSTLAQLASQKAAIQAQIDLSQAKYDQLVIDIANTEKKIKDNQDALGQTIADLYVDAKISPLEMLASSKNISDYLDKQEYRNSVRDQLTSTIAEIKDLKTKLDTQKTEVQKVLAEQQSSRDALVARENEQQDLLNRTQGQESNYQQMIGNSINQINEARALQAALKQRGASTGGYTIISSGSAPAYGPWDDNTCPMGGYINGQWIEYASTKGSDGNGGDGYGFGCRQCASYVAWRIGKKTSYYPSGGGANGWGDAYSFTWKAKGAPWNGVETSTPHKNSIAVLGNSAPGHVAWVETDPYISTSGPLLGQSVIQVSQYNWNYGQGYGMYSVMELSVNFFDHYIQL